MSNALRSAAGFDASAQVRRFGFCPGANACIGRHRSVVYFQAIFPTGTGIHRNAIHPCLRCGACCAHYRVAFHWLEADPTGSGVPWALTEKLDDHRLVMRGTRSTPVRCVALDAVIGERSHCAIHARRPSVCREVAAAWENGAPSPQCDRARAAYGLAALTPGDWLPAEAGPARAMPANAGLTPAARDAIDDAASADRRS